MTAAHAHDTALSALRWQIELGADEAIADAPISRYTDPAPAAAPESVSPAPARMAPSAAGAADPAPSATGAADDPVAAARAAAGAARTFDDLRAALEAYPHCELRQGARSLVFSDGNPAARVMIIGEAPGREEDQRGLPFVGRAGQLLDRMFAAIGMARDAPDAEHALYITNVLPWRPPQNRDPQADEIAMMMPFLSRHVDLADPDVLVLMGNHACQALLGRKGITRLRGTWTEALGRPGLPMFHPAYLLRNPHAKREAWADLLTLRARLGGAA